VAPLIPYIEAPEIPLSFLKFIPLFDPAHPPSIKPFGTLVAIGVYIGSVVAMRHARQRGMDLKKMNELIFWVVAAGFIGGHMLDAIFYHPDRLARDPLYLFKLWDGLSSYGGFIGAVTGLLLFRAVRKEPVLDYADVICSAFPLAWVFGRAGCATVHDHPGRLSDAWYAVKWPHLGAHMGRLDLGLIEMVLTIPLAIAYAVAWHRKPFRPSGFYVGWMCVAYAPVRFLLDFLRADESSHPSGGDPRYGGLTPAQWACFGLLALGIAFVRRSMNASDATPGDGAASSEPGGASGEGDEGDGEGDEAATVGVGPSASSSGVQRAPKAESGEDEDATRRIDEPAAPAGEKDPLGSSDRKPLPSA
jgi:phosphatidylglycerol:prolipoprotein diacylglycerol transferase